MSAEAAKIVTLLEADLPRIVMSGFASRRTKFSLRMDGPVGSKEIGGLIKQLELQRELLAEDEAEHATLTDGGHDA